MLDHTKAFEYLRRAMQDDPTLFRGPVTARELNALDAAVSFGTARTNGMSDLEAHLELIRSTLCLNGRLLD